jgi:hypothetical protein
MAELAICDRWGVGHSQFLALPLDDQDKAIAYAEYRGASCPRCGTEKEEWDPRVGGDINAYVPEDHRCRGCEVIAQHSHRQEAFSKVHGREALFGVTTILVRPPMEEVDES